MNTRLRVLTTKEFDRWLEKQSKKLKAMIISRLDLLTLKHFGNHKRFDGLIEFKWKNGTRIYSFMWGRLDYCCTKWR